MLSASGRERMIHGGAVASEDKRIVFSVGIARFGAILKERGRPSRSGLVRSLSIRWMVSCISQRGRVCARPDPAGRCVVGREAWRVGRENSGQVDVGGQPGFPGAGQWAAAYALSADLWAGWG